MDTSEVNSYCDMNKGKEQEKPQWFEAKMKEGKLSSQHGTGFVKG